MERKKYSNYELNCPKNGEEYLGRTYGDDWKTSGSTQSLIHSTLEFINELYQKLKLNFY